MKMKKDYVSDKEKLQYDLFRNYCNNRGIPKNQRPDELWCFWKEAWHSAELNLKLEINKILILT